MGSAIRPHLLSDMALIVTLYQRQSFSGAAKHVGIATSSFSRRVAAFEKELGMRLIDRTTRRFAFTPSGTAYAREATRILDEAERVFGDFQVHTKALAGEIRIAVPQINIVVRQLAQFIALFSQERSDISFHVESVATPVQALSRDCDVAIVAGIPNEASTIVRKIGDVDTGIFASKSYLDRHQRPARPTDLRGLHLLTVENFGTAWRLRRDGTAADVPLNGAGTCNSFTVAEDLVAAGNGVALLPTSLAELRRGGHGDIEQLLPDWLPQSIPLYFAMPSRLISARTKLFIDAALDYFRRRPFNSPDRPDERTSVVPALPSALSSGMDAGVRSA